ncbi:MAG: flippase-like domain-containing protein [Candidatus Adiutrix intracellularis]|jgi:uncharacterized membrane protein YbhN (UPF0104 family)|nr:flippase-like domain-containing protein [Candidatus Adiutrix intracellularis]
MMEIDSKKLSSSSLKILAKFWKTAKWLVMAGALVYLGYMGVLSGEKLNFSNSAWWCLPLAFFFLILSVFTFSLRFHWLLTGLGSPSNISRQLKIHFSGILVQQIGSEISFEALRLVSNRALGSRGPDILVAAILDRLLGVSTLILLIALTFTFFLSTDRWNQFRSELIIFIVITLAAFLILALRRRLTQLKRPSWLRHLPGGAFLVEVTKAIQTFRRPYIVLTTLFFLSLAGHLATFITLYFCGLSLTGINLSPLESVTGGAIFLFTGALPLPLAGLGVGETVFGQVVADMRGLGIPADFASVFLINRLFLLILGTISWLCLVSSKDIWRKQLRGG